MDGRMNVSDQGIIQMVNHAAIATVQGLAVFMGCRHGLESLTNDTIHLESVGMTIMTMCG